MVHVLRRLLSVEASDAVVAAAPAMAPREVFRRFWPYTRSGRRWLVPVLLFSPVGPAVNASEIWLFKTVVDAVLVPRELRPLLWIRDATRIVVLDHGRIVEHGAHDDLLGCDGTYARLHRLSAGAVLS
ncbi:hypothetical protein ACFY0A_25520 [Streptomyces sp. NPDC001698]|uniref:hypothetical protein n=1 Tax=Streptomyces sp. NPDC001698 TaxID=3364601 RepID=UPI00369BC1C2